MEAANSNKLTVDNSVYATGKRKNAIARVWLKKGSGLITINGRTFENYFSCKATRNVVVVPIELTENSGLVDVICTISGGGYSGQAGALRHGISKALNILDHDAYHLLLKKHGLLTRDSRVVERKKYGKSKARKSFQFSKR